MYKYEFTSKAFKQLHKLDKVNQFRILDKLDYIANSPTPFSFVDHLTDTCLGGYRLRVGDYRVIFDIEGDVLVILKVGHRRDIYR